MKTTLDLQVWERGKRAELSGVMEKAGRNKKGGCSF